MSRNKVFNLAVLMCVLGWIGHPSAYGTDPDVTRAENWKPDFEEQPISVFDEGAPEDSDVAPAVNVSPLGEIDLHVKDLDLSRVLQLLSIQAQRNIVASRNVAGRVSADLYGVDFYEALDAILHPNGFGYQEKGNFIYIYTQQELAAIKDAERQLATRIVRLSYITAADAGTFVSPLLSPAGSIAVSGAPAAGFEASSGDGGANSFAHADTLVIRDFPENVAEIVETLKTLDVRPQQVLIEATILEASLTDNTELGVDLSVMADFRMSQFVDPLNIVDELVSGAVGPASGGGTGGGGHTSVGNAGSDTASVKLGIVNNDFAVFIQAMDTVRDVTVLANPKLLVLNRQRAKLLVGERKGYISTTATDTSTTQTVEFLELGTQLSVRPFVGDDDFIRLEIKPQISSGDVGLIGSFVVPQSNNQELTTNVMVRNGQTVILGGLFKESTTVNRRQVPFLGDVPILGTAFRGQDDSVVRSEYIFMVTPTIVKDKALYAAGDRAKDSVELITLGARESLLPFSRGKMTANHLRQAMRHMDAGDTRRALWSTNLALGLDQTSLEARRLKEQITGERIWYPTRSMLEDAIEKMEHEQLDAAAEQAEIIDPHVEAIDEVQPQAQQSAEQPAETDMPSAVVTEPAAQPTVEAQPVVEVQPVVEPQTTVAQPQSVQMVPQPQHVTAEDVTAMQQQQVDASQPTVNMLERINSWVPAADNAVTEVPVDDSVIE